MLLVVCRLLSNFDGNAGTGGKRLRVVEVDLRRCWVAGPAHRRSAGSTSGKRLVLDAAVRGDDADRRRYIGADAEGRLHQTGCARARAARAARRAAGARARSSRAEAADASAGRALHDAGVDAAERCRRPWCAGCRCRRSAGCSARSPGRDCSPAPDRSHPSARCRACRRESADRDAASSPAPAWAPWSGVYGPSGLCECGISKRYGAAFGPDGGNGAVAR